MFWTKYGCDLKTKHIPAEEVLTRQRGESVRYEWVETRLCSDALQLDSVSPPDKVLMGLP